MIPCPSANHPIEIIADLPAGAGGIVHSLTGGRELRSRMANLGFTAGADIRVRQNYGRGPVVVAVRGALVALGRAEAKQIRICPSEA